jgi:5'-AMP-activated protein kinase catalytic alpha subunit
MIAGKRYAGLGSDIWSCGIILYAMTCGYLPFEDPNTNKLYKKILACDYKIPGFISVQNKDIMQKILSNDPAKRLSIQDIRAHDWYGKSRSVELNGIIVGKDRIPVIPEQLENLKNYFSGEQLDEAAIYV